MSFSSFLPPGGRSGLPTADGVHVDDLDGLAGAVFLPGAVFVPGGEERILTFRVHGGLTSYVGAYRTAAQAWAAVEDGLDQV